MQYKFNYIKIQEKINEGLSWREIQNEFNIPSSTIHRYVKRGLIKFKSKSEAMKLMYKKYPERVSQHSEEVRKKISKGRKKYLQENPDKIPYLLNHKSKGDSYPEKYFEECLKHSNYTKKYQIGLYQLDFADLNNKIDLEIDGCQHRLDPKIVEHDIKRNNNLISLGWKIIRVNWSEFQKLSNLDKIKIVNQIIEQAPIESKTLKFFGF